MNEMGSLGEHSGALELLQVNDNLEEPAPCQVIAIERCNNQLVLYKNLRMMNSIHIK